MENFDLINYTRQARKSEVSDEKIREEFLRAVLDSIRFLEEKRLDFYLSLAYKNIKIMLISDSKTKKYHEI